MKKNTLKKAVLTAVAVLTVCATVPGTDAQAAVKLNRTSVTVKAGKSVTLKLKGNTKKVKWASNKKAVAVVTQKGKVTGRKAGKAVITAKAGKKTYKCKVTVKAVKKAEIPSVKDDAVNDTVINDAVTDNTVTDGTGTEISGSGTETQAPAQGTEVTAPAHTHDYIPHYSYDGSGNPIKDAYFCSDVACSENRGYGTDDGWRGEKAPGYTTEFGYGTGNAGNTGSTQPPVSGNTGNGTAGSTGTETQKPEETVKPEEKPADTENKEPVQTEEQPAAHAHSWTVPVMSADGIMLEGYRCAGCSETSHVHMWAEGIMEGTWVKARKCACGETISAEDYETLRSTEQAMQKTVMEKWIAKNITPGMTDLEKAKEAVAEMNSYTHIATLPAEEQKGLSCLAKTGSCLGGNNMFAEYCRAMGIQAEVFSAGQYVGGEHYLTYVYVNGEKLIADGTPGGSIAGPGTLWTETALNLYADMLDGVITVEEYEAQIAAEER